MNDESKSTLVRASIEGAGYEAASYSGRGMFGKTCLSFTVEAGDTECAATAKIMLAAIEAPDWKADDVACSAFEDARTDQMGMGTVVYFPDLPWVE